MRFPRSFLTLILALTVTVFVSCTGSSAGPDKKGGTGDGGGGTGLDSKLFEQYIRSSDQILEQNPLLADLLKNLEPEASGLPLSGLKSSVEYVLKFKKWLFIPAKVKHIDSSKMGLGSSENQFEQYAFQNDREVWINNDSFEKMDAEGRFSLLVHEVFLDLFLKSKIVKLFEAEDNSVLSVLPSFCATTETLLQASQRAKICSEVKATTEEISQYSLLKSEDYGPIRAATSQLLQLKTKEQVVAVMGKLFELGYSAAVVSRPVLPNPQLQPQQSGKALSDAAAYVLAMKEVLSCSVKRGFKTIERAKAESCSILLDSTESVKLSLVVGKMKSKSFAYQIAAKQNENGLEERSLVGETSVVDAIDQSSTTIIDTAVSGDKESFVITIKTSWSRTELVEVWDRNKNETWSFQWKLEPVKGFNF